MKEDINALDEIHKGSCMGIDAIDFVLDKVEDNNLKKELKKEYKEYQWNVRFRERRKKGVKRFWRQERERLLRGERGTRNWTKEQRAAIIRGETPKFKGLYVIGHHSYSAVKYPHLADKGEIIYPATLREHFRGWHGGNYKKSSAGKPIVLIIDF